MGKRELRGKREGRGGNGGEIEGGGKWGGRNGEGEGGMGGGKGENGGVREGEKWYIPHILKLPQQTNYVIKNHFDVKTNRVAEIATQQLQLAVSPMNSRLSQGSELVMDIPNTEEVEEIRTFGAEINRKSLDDPTACPIANARTNEFDD